MNDQARARQTKRRELEAEKKKADEEAALLNAVNRLEDADEDDEDVESEDPEIAAAIKREAEE